jgi:plasmid stabilization system protein ParE
MTEKTYAVQILDPAQSELEEIAQLYLSLVGVQSARKITDKIYAALEQLAHFPLSGPTMRESELRKLGYRFIVVEKYIIIYRLIGDTVFVYHIFDGRSDYPSLFRSELFKS